MATSITFLLVGTLLIWLVRVGNGMLNHFSVRRLQPIGWTSEDGPPTRVSICVPARNEAQALQISLPRMLAQDYPNYEVIVVDDRSEDGTAEVLSRFSGNAKLHVVEGTQPPAGKIGKCWALDQAQRTADGEYLCFSDADINYDVSALSSAMREAKNTGADLVLLLPRMQMDTFSERLLIPTYVYSMIFGIALWLVNRDKRPSRSLGNGALMLLRRRAYEQIGGHAALLNQVVDDITLAERIIHSGFRQRIYNGDHLVSVRMYRGFADIWNGLSKNLGAAGQGSLGTAVLLLAVMLFANFLPLLVLFRLPFAPSDLDAALVAANLVLILGSDMWLRIKMYSPGVMAILRHVAILVLTAIMIRSILLHWRRKVVWRGRTVVSGT